jgi:PAT family beta-lactamase induction signal transducer AmpG
MDGRLLSVKPAVFIPTLYFIEGLPYTMVTVMSLVMFKNLGATNIYIGLVTSNLTLPWVLKAFWAPIIDLVGTRRSWVLVAHVVLAGLSLVLASICHVPGSTTITTPTWLNTLIPAGAGLSETVPNAVLVASLLFGVIAIVSATQDIAIDGYYMDVLNKEQQAFFVGFRNAAYKVAFLTGQGALVIFVGYLAEKLGFGYQTGWSASFLVCAVLFVLAALFHSMALPSVAQTRANVDAASSPATQLRTQFKQVFKTYFTQHRALAIVVYILTFRLGDALMLKMTVPFILDKRAAGGLGVSTLDEGFIYGTVGMIALLVGGIVGSWLLSKFGTKRCLMPAAIVQSAAIPLYWALAVFRPGLEAVAVVNAFEQFAYGIGATAYTVYLLSTVKAEFRASHYAIATGLMALGLLIPGSISGYLTILGYPNFFLISFLASIPGIITILFLPFQETAAAQGAENGIPQVGEMGH